MLGAHGIDGFGVIVCGNDIMRAAVKYGVRGVEPWDRPGSGVAKADVAERDGPVFLNRARHMQSGECCSSHYRPNRHCMLEDSLKGQQALSHVIGCSTSHAMTGGVKQRSSSRRALLTPQTMQEHMYACTQH